MMTKFISASITGLFLAGILALPVMAQENSASSKPQVDLTCMQNAVEKRDSAIIAAWDAHSAAIKSALQTRKDALKAAWGIQDKKARRAAIAAAWKAFDSNRKKATKDLRAARLAAWKQFYTDRKACGTHVIYDDATNSNVDSSTTY